MIAIAPGRYADVLLALISSRIHQVVVAFDDVINPSDSDFDHTGLKAASVVRLARLATVESAIINARLGKISSDRLQQIIARLVDWLQQSA